jgi:uncharacterized YccA/Bax inhibitor family protein
MRFTSTSNPVLTRKAFEAQADGQVMTIQGTVNKSFILLLILLITATLAWRITTAGSTSAVSLMLPAALVGFGLALVTIFVKKIAFITAPLYVAAEGFFLGSISVMYNYLYPGIIIQAVMLTLGILALLLFAYKTGLIKMSQKLRSGIMIATGGIALVYLVSFGMNMFGASMPYIHDGGPIGIGISLFIVIIAALNLILDFSFIEDSAKQNAPKYLEWYAAFGLMVTLIWLYLEILRLLGKIRN